MSALRVVSFCAVAGALIVAPAPLAARQFQARPTEGFVMPLADGRMAVLLTREGGVVVDGVVAADQPGSGPETDLRRGDLVVSFQQSERPSLTDIAQAWERIADSAQVTIAVERSGARHQVRFRKPATRSTPVMRMAISGQEGAGTGAWVGAGGGSSGTTEVVISGNHIRENDQGMPYVAFRASDPGASAVGLRTGDVITHFSGRSLAALRGLEMLYNAAAAGEEIVLTVQRGGRSESVRFRKSAP